MCSDVIQSLINISIILMSYTVIPCGFFWPWIHVLSALTLTASSSLFFSTKIATIATYVMKGSICLRHDPKFMICFCLLSVSPIFVLATVTHADQSRLPTDSSFKNSNHWCLCKKFRRLSTYTASGKCIIYIGELAESAKGVKLQCSANQCQKTWAVD